MCIGGSPSYAVPQRQEAAFKDAPPVVTGEQTGVDNPKDTKKATEELKIRRQKKEGTYVDPNLSRTEELLTGTRRNNRNLTRAMRARGLTSGSGDRTAARNRAKNMARARLCRNSRMSGSRSSKRR